jgi:hypothetical protein
MEVSSSLTKKERNKTKLLTWLSMLRTILLISSTAKPKFVA